MRFMIPMAFGLLLAGALFITGCITAERPGQGTSPPPEEGYVVNIAALGRNYPTYLTLPPTPGKHPAIVLIHSFNGLEQGYKDMMNRMAADGFLVIAPEWQTFNKSPPDTDTAAVIQSDLAYLATRPEADISRVGLTGFCAGGRYTMLFLPRMKEFRSGLAWYGFPYNGATPDAMPVNHIPELSVPMLMIHGSRDMASPIQGIYNYSIALDAAGKYFELKEYQGKPHGFMITNGSLSQDDASMDAYREMLSFFRRTLG